MSTIIENWTLGEIAAAVGGKVIAGDPSSVIRGVTTDSRSIPPRSLFIALKGERFDAHSFVSAVALAGAAAALVERPVPAPAGFALIHTGDTTTALGDLARAYRLRFTPVVAGVTGSSGKTSTKNFLAAICARRFRTVATTGNLNNHIGVPLTLFGLASRTERAVIEMGMSNRGEIARLAEIARPSIGIISSIGPCHLETLGSIEGVIDAKSELTEFLNENGGTLVLSSDHEHFAALRRRAACRVITAGTDASSDVRITNVVADGFRHATFAYRGIDVQLRLPGLHMAQNAALAAAAAELMGIDALDIVEGLASVYPDKGRASAHVIDGVTIVDDAYNSNPLSLAAAIRMLSEEKASRRILVMSDMLELGAESIERHESIGRLIAERKIDVLVFRGERTKAAAAAAGIGVKKYECATNEEIAETVVKLMQTGDVVLFKASHGMRLDEAVKRVIDHKSMIARGQVLSMRK